VSEELTESAVSERNQWAAQINLNFTSRGWKWE